MHLAPKGTKVIQGPPDAAIKPLRDHGDFMDTQMEGAGHGRSLLVQATGEASVGNCSFEVQDSAVSILQLVGRHSHCAEVELLLDVPEALFDTAQLTPSLPQRVTLRGIRRSDGSIPILQVRGCTHVSMMFQ